MPCTGSVFRLSVLSTPHFSALSPIQDDVAGGPRRLLGSDQDAALFTVGWGDDPSVGPGALSTLF